MMSRFVFTIAILLFSLNTLRSQEVQEIQKSLITKITATWCPNCGGWGWTFFDSIFVDNAAKALIIKANYSGELQNPTAADFATNFNTNYQPYFIVGNENQNVTSTNTAAKRTTIKNLVDNNYATPPVVNAGLEVTKNGDFLNVQTKTRFFQNTEGEYYLGIYVIEDGVINFQQNQGNDAVHKNVLRASMSSGSFGELITSGIISSGSEFDKPYSILLGNWNLNNLEIAAIIWKKVGNTFEFVNTHSTTEISTVGIASIPEDEIGFHVFPTITAGNVTIELNLKNENTAIQLELADLSGKKLATIFEGNAGARLRTFEINRTMAGASGLYFIVLRHGNAVSTKKIIFQ